MVCKFRDHWNKYQNAIYIWPLQSFGSRYAPAQHLAVKENS